MSTLSGERWATQLLRDEQPIHLSAARLHHRDWAWSNLDHSSQRQLIMVVERGAVDLYTNGKRCRIHAGEACWVPFGTDRGIGSDGGIERHFNIGFTCSGDLQRGPFTKIAVRAECWPILALAHRLRDDEVQLQQLHVRSYLAAIAIEFCRAPKVNIHARLQANSHSATEKTAPQTHTLSPQQRAMIEQWANEHLQHGPIASDIAHVLGLSHDYASRCFKASYGVSPRRWLRDQRIRAAAADLADEQRPIRSICERYGFSDESFFCKQFRAVMGCSPGQWRQRERAAEWDPPDVRS